MRLLITNPGDKAKIKDARRRRQSVAMTNVLAFDQRALLHLDRAYVVPRMKRCVIGLTRSRLRSYNSTARPRTRKRADEQNDTATRRSVSHAPLWRQTRGTMHRYLPPTRGKKKPRSLARPGTNAHRQDSLETAGTRKSTDCQWRYLHGATIPLPPPLSLFVRFFL